MHRNYRAQRQYLSYSGMKLPCSSDQLWRSKSAFRDNPWLFQDGAAARPYKIYFPEAGLPAVMERGIREVLFALRNYPEAAGKGKRWDSGTLKVSAGQLVNYAQFLVERDVLEFKLALRSHADEYRDKLKQDGKKTTYLVRVFQSLNKLHELKDFFEGGLTDYLLDRPTGDIGIRKYVGWKEQDEIDGRTLPIFEDSLRKIYEAALNTLDTAPSILSCYKAVYPELADYSTRHHRVKVVMNERLVTPWGFRNPGDLKRAIRRLKTACFILLDICTGMRISELLSARQGCIETVKHSDNVTFHFIRSVLFKTEDEESGRSERWMCGEVGARAASILEDIVAAMYPDSTNRYLFEMRGRGESLGFRTNEETFRIEHSYMAKLVKEFCEELGILDVHPHRFRRTFARNIVRYGKIPITALQNHFKHTHIHLTAWYAGHDDLEMLKWIEEDELERHIEICEELRRTPLVGPAAEMFSKMFQGRTQDGNPESWVERLWEAGIILRECTDIGWCAYVQEHALCSTGPHPQMSMCEPERCFNALRGPQHLPGLLFRLAYKRKELNALSERDKNGPRGNSLSKRIRVLEEDIKKLQTKK